MCQFLSHPLFELCKKITKGFEGILLAEIAYHDINFIKIFTNDYQYFGDRYSNVDAFLMGVNVFWDDWHYWYLYAHIAAILLIRL